MSAPGAVEGEAAATARSARYLALAAAAVGWALGYALPVYARLPNVFYDPARRRFFVARSGGALPMGYYGQLLFAAAAALLLGGLAFAASRRRASGAISARAIGLAAAWALTALALAFAWFTWNNWP